jgi:hypothetical protein
VTNGVTFNNLTVTNSTGGIAFYDDSTSGVIDPISNVKFNGTTTISGTGYGIDVNDAADVSGGTLVTSPKAQNLNLGTLNISGVTSGAIIAGAADRVVVANDSVINGTAVSSLSASQLETLLGLPAGVITISGKPAAVTPPTNPTKPAVEIPGAPNTGDSSNSLAFIVISIVAVLSAAIVGAIGITRFARKQS